MRSTILPVALLAMALFSLTGATAPLYGDTSCGSNLSNLNCAIIITNENIDNIAHSIVSGGGNPGNRVDLRDKSNPGTYYWFTSGTDSALAKSILAVLLTAKSTGANVKLWIAWSSAAGDSRNFSSATLVNP